MYLSELYTKVSFPETELNSISDVTGKILSIGDGVKYKATVIKNERNTIVEEEFTGTLLSICKFGLEEDIRSLYILYISHGDNYVVRLFDIDAENRNLELANGFSVELL